MESKTEQILAMMAAGATNRAIAEAVHVREAYVSRLRNQHRPACTQKPSTAPTVTPPRVLIDPLKPAAPQLEATAWAVIANAAAGGEVTVRQLHAAREIIKAAQRDKVPPPVNRKLKLVIDVIDVMADDKIHRTKTLAYEVKP